MRRREFITLLGGVVALAPHSTYAQQQPMPVIGFLNGQAQSGFVHLVAAFHQGLSEAGYVEGKNLEIEYRWAEGQPDRLPVLAEELVRRRVDLIVATGGAHAAAKAATTTIPIVVAFGGDPVKLGYVESINRPGRNLTVVSVFSSDLEAKRLQLLHEVVPKDALVGVLLDPTFASDLDAQLQEVESAARLLGRTIQILKASTVGEIDTAISSLVTMRGGGLHVTGAPTFLNLRDHLLALTKAHSLPAIYENREFIAAGGLMSYGTSVPDVYRQIGVYAARILTGDKPAELPVLQPTKFDIAVNLRTAKELGIELPTSILLRADEVIE
jgi:putative ABC transport system substrate-binding protein